MDRGHVASSEFHGTQKVARFSVLTCATPAGETESLGGFAEAFGAWYAVSRPELPTRDALGTLTGMCEALTSEEGDQQTIVATRDVRAMRFAQDLGNGEFCFTNLVGSRLFVGKKNVALSAYGGAFLTFSIDSKKVTLCGFPAKTGGGAPCLTIGSTSIGMTSETGHASFVLGGEQATISGSAISLDAGRVNCGKGANDPVVTFSQLQAVVQAIMATFNAHGHGGGGAAPPATPLLVALTPGTRVFAAL